jgi:hypothetical protein
MAHGESRALPSQTKDFFIRDGGASRNSHETKLALSGQFVDRRSADAELPGGVVYPPSDRAGISPDFAPCDLRLSIHL